MLVGGLAHPADAAKKHRKKHKPRAPRSLTSGNVPDPSVVRTRSGYVVVSTGIGVPRATSAGGLTFRTAGQALVRLPTWARTGDVWAADVAPYHGRWLLFFAASVPGMKRSSHCIGVAVAPRPTAAFTPVDDRPLVCPPDARVPDAEDQFVDTPPPPAPTAAPGQPPPAAATPSAPRPNPPNAHGAIDPSFTVIGNHPYLLYKTDGRPSSVRLLPLSADGRHAAGRSRQILVSRGVIENPVLTRKGPWWYLFTSEGDYSRCTYQTVWRRSKNPLGSWQRPMAHVFLSHAKQGLCGPGGADVVVTGKKQLMYFHGWTCHHTRKACASPLHAYNGHDASRAPVRALYGLRLTFTRAGYPRIGKWLKAR